MVFGSLMLPALAAPLTQVPCTATRGPTGSNAGSPTDHAFHTTCYQQGDKYWSFSYDDVYGEVWVSQGGDDFSGSYSSPRDKGNYEGSYTSNDMCTTYWGNSKNGNAESGFFALQIGSCDTAQVPCIVISGPTGSNAGSPTDHAFHTTCYQQGDKYWSFSYDDVHGEVWVSQGGDDFSGSYSSPRDTGTYEGSFTSNAICTSYWGNWEHENG